MATKRINTDFDFGNAARILNIPDAVDPQQPVTLNQLTGFQEGLSWKADVRAASTGNLNLGSMPANVDGVALSNDDRFLAKDQTDASENGIYIFNGAGVAATRALDANSAEALISATVQVEEGTSNSGTTWRQTQIITTLGTDDVLWEPFGTSVPDASTSTKGKIAIATQAEVDAGDVGDKTVTPETLKNASFFTNKFATTIGDNSNTALSITHNLGTTDVGCHVYRTSGSKDEIICEVDILDANTITLKFATAPATNSLRAVVFG